MRDEHRDLKILYVEDDAASRLLFKEIGSILGWHVTTANDGALGLALAAMVKYDLIVTDQRMPNMTGLEMVEEIRRSETINRVTPVMVCSSCEIAELQENPVFAHVDGYLQKPLSLRRIEGAVSEILDECAFNAPRSTYACGYC
jgi:CheY-like chemotaxis protein